MSIPTDAAARKAIPIFSGVLRYFPDALAEVAAVSKAGNDQHNPGQPLHWAKQKSRDELDALTRHLFDAGTIDSDGMRHSAKVAWRALANLQREIDRENGYDYDAEKDEWRIVTPPAVKELERRAARPAQVHPYYERPNICTEPGCAAPVTRAIARLCEAHFDIQCGPRLDVGDGAKPMLIPNETDAAARRRLGLP